MLCTPPPCRRLTFSLFARSSNSWTSEGGFAILNVSSSASVFLSQVVTSLISEFSCCKSCFTLSFLRSSCACSSSHLSKAPGVKSSSHAPISLPPAQTCRGCPLPEASLSWRWTGLLPLLWCKGCATTPTKAWGRRSPGRRPSMWAACVLVPSSAVQFMLLSGHFLLRSVNDQVRATSLTLDSGE